MTSIALPTSDSMRGRIRQILRQFNLEVRRFNPDDHAELRRARMLQSNDISLVLDVGANIGRYGQSLRKTGYRGRIVSFEPLSGAFAILQQVSASDPLWDCHNCALGNSNGESVINVAGNSVSSSLLAMDAEHVHVAPQSAYVDTELIRVKKLNRALIGPHQNDRIFVKVDVQGYEHEVLAGAVDIMSDIVGLEIELSLASLYSGQLSFRQMTDLLDDLGFQLVSFERGLTNSESGHILQIDGIFLRSR